MRGRRHRPRAHGRPFPCRAWRPSTALSALCRRPGPRPLGHSALSLSIVTPASPGGSLLGTSVSSAVQRQPPAWPALPSASLVEGPWAGGRGHGASRPGGGLANGRGSAQACLSAEGPGEGMGGTPSRRPVPTETHTPGAAGAPCGLARVPLGSCVDKAALSNEGPPALLCAR